ncbi:hypothetical protein MTO96_045168 [Rhipicephalus appendiculatus]
MEALAHLPALKIKWMVMMHNMHHARRAIASRNLEEYFSIRQTMRSTSMLISQITQSVSVVEREVQRLEARNRALRRDNARLLRKLSRLRREPLTIQIPPGGLPPTCYEDSMGADSCTGSIDSGFPSGTDIEGGVVATMHRKAEDNSTADDTPGGDESMETDL